jgi:hypothetical protein
MVRNPYKVVSTLKEVSMLLLLLERQMEAMNCGNKYAVLFENGHIPAETMASVQVRWYQLN